MISSAQFSVYLFDKNKVRIGEDVISLSNLGPGETVKFQTTVAASGTPVSVSIQDQAQIPQNHLANRKLYPARRNAQVGWDRGGNHAAND